VYGDGLISIAVSGELAGSLVDQQGQIAAPGGQVWIGASHLGGALTGVVNVGGLVQANSMADLLGGGANVAAPAGAVTVSGRQIKLQGTIEAKALSQGAAAGTIDVLGDQIALRGAVLSVDGVGGGGQIRIGGDQRGANAELYRPAQTVLVDGASRISANALGTGDGGRVILWSEERTEHHGVIEARGGEEGGDGGFVETSSAKVLHVSGRVSTAAPKGKAGQWLLDPEEVQITDDASSVSVSGREQRRGRGRNKRCV